MYVTKFFVKSVCRSTNINVKVNGSSPQRLNKFPFFVGMSLSTTSLGDSRGVYFVPPVQTPGSFSVTGGEDRRGLTLPRSTFGSGPPVDGFQLSAL